MSAREAIGLDSHKAAAAPYSPILRYGELLFVSGQVAIGPDGTLVEGGIAEQTEQVLTNLAVALEQAGSGLDRLLKCNVFLADLGDWAAMNEVWIRRIGLPRPARCAVGASLPDGMLLEVDAIAATGDSA
ncbi:MAG TPA: Rid family hydrolase [Conexibacter sp.]|nr:Rid family hydrolase [Conexibacter sp.]